MLKTISSSVNAIGALNFKGTWNASTNTPTIVSGSGVKGDYFVVGVEGTTTIDGISNWGVGDWIAYNGSVWQRVEGGADLNGVNASISGNLAFTGSSNRIRGDFSNATVASRVAFQTSTTDGATRVAVIPNGTGTASAIGSFNNSDANNSSILQLTTTSTVAAVSSTVSGTGTPLPMVMQVGGADRVRINTTGDVLTSGVASTTYNGSLYRSTGTIELTAGSSINLSSVVCGAAVVAVFSTGVGTGGLFFLNFGSTSVKVAGDGEATDTGSSFAVFKSAASHTSTLKNTAAITQTFSVVVLAGRLA